jgi:hypothetical protein
VTAGRTPASAPATSFLGSAALALGRSLEPVQIAFESPEDLRQTLAALGWEAEFDDTSIVSICEAFAAQRSAFERALELASEIQSGSASELEVAEELIDLLTGVIETARSLAGAPPPQLPFPLDQPSFWAQAPWAMVDLALLRYLRSDHPVVAGVLVVLGLAEAYPEAPAGTGRRPYVRQRLRWDRLERMVGDPLGLLRDVYAWGLDARPFEHNRVVESLTDFFHCLRLPARLTPPPTDVLDIYYASDSPHRSSIRQLGVPILAEASADRSQYAELGFALVPIPPDDDRAGPPTGVALLPLVEGSFSAGASATDQPFTLRVTGGFDLAGPFAMEFRPDGVSLRAAPGTSSIDAKLEVSGTPDTPWRLLGVAGSHRLELAGLRAGAYVTGRLDDPEFVVEAGTTDGTATPEFAFVLDGSGADGFIKQLMGGQPQRVTFGGGIRWSSKSGLTFAGTAQLDVLVPVNQEIALVEIRSLRLAAKASAGRVRAHAALSAAARLGPLVASIAEIGAELTLAPVAAGEPLGTFGDVDVHLDFKPPDGVGLSIDAGAVTGGGFLQFNEPQAQYVGALHLQFEEVSVNAIGILTTRLPGGQAGYSLVILIQATGFAPVQLGFGFSLTGVGGLLGVNRGVNVEVLRAGIKSRALDPILFTKDDPVPRAGEIVAALQNVFPPTADSHVFGPMAEITWGTPPLLTIEIALLLQLPAPLRLIILGRIKARLPAEQPPLEGVERKPLVSINLDALGVVDFDRREASVDAALYDSNLFEFALTGEMALRASWGENPQFALAVGGFHPRFQAPPGFPQLGRVALTLATGDNPRLRMEAYLALTSNTVQFGSRLDFYFRADQLSLEGMLGFDTLINLSPFGFTADIAGSLLLKWGPDPLFAVWIAMAFSGPNPWYARCRATFDLFGWKQSIEFETTIGQPVDESEPELVDVGKLLCDEVEKPISWSGQLPSDGQIVALRAAAPDGAVLVHPGGELSVSQRIVPLDREISAFGTSIPAKERTFSLALILGGDSENEPVLDYFARGQFWRLSDDERLAAPSFDRMPAGVRAGGGYTNGEGVSADIVYDTKIVTLDGRGGALSKDAPTYELPAEQLEPLAETGAAALAAVGRTGRAKYRGEQLGVTVADTEYVVAKSNLEEVAGTEVTGGSYTAAAEALRNYAESHPGEHLQIVARYEARRVA